MFQHLPGCSVAIMSVATWGGYALSLAALFLHTHPARYASAEYRAAPAPLLSTFSTPAFAAVRLSIAPPSCALLLQVMEGLLRWIKHCERRVELLKPCDPLLSSAFGARGILAAGGDSHRPFCMLHKRFSEVAFGGSNVLLGS